MLKTYFRASQNVLASALLAASCLTAAPRFALAQALVLSVNGMPITTYDIDQRMKLLRLLRKPASRQAATDDLIDDKVKLDEISKFTIHLSDSDIMAQAGLDAQELKIPPATFIQELQSSGIDKDNWQEHFKAQAEWNLYVKAMNKTLDVSSQEVDAALAKRGDAAALIEYLVREIVIVIPDPNAVAAKMPEADELRARFDGCESGAAMARSEPNVVVQPLVTRDSTNLTDQIRSDLEKTDVGRLTPPERTAEGIEMIAVCGKKAVHDDSAVATPIRDQLLQDRLDRASAQLFAPIRARAVIVRFHS